MYVYIYIYIYMYIHIYIYMYTYILFVSSAQTGAQRRKHAQKDIEKQAPHCPRQRLPPRAPRQNPWISSWAAPPTCSCSRGAARRRLCRRSRTSRSWVSTSSHISARRAGALRPKARRGVHGDQGHGQGDGDCVCVERPQRGGL